MSRKVRLSAWMDVEGAEWCSMRVIDEHDPKDVANRYAFIEKTPRIRVKEFDYDAPRYDYKNWFQGPKGDSQYGHNQASRDWCDEQLIALGYELL